MSVYTEICTNSVGGDKAGMALYWLSSFCLSWEPLKDKDCAYVCVCVHSSSPSWANCSSSPVSHLAKINWTIKKQHTQAQFHWGPTPKLFQCCFITTTTLPSPSSCPPPFFFFACFYSEVRWKLSLLPRSVAFEWYQTSAQVHRAPKTATE